MREIKFRVWDKEDQRLFIPDGLYFTNGDPYLNPKRNFFMQFTGIKDKNGKDIYEGDIVQGVTWKEPYAMRTSKLAVGKVAFIQDQGFCWVGRLPDGYRTYPLLERSEVIGNIYENPELINVADKTE